MTRHDMKSKWKFYLSGNREFCKSYHVRRLYRKRKKNGFNRTTLFNGNTERARLCFCQKFQTYCFYFVQNCNGNWTRLLPTDLDIRIVYLLCLLWLVSIHLSVFRVIIVTRVFSGLLFLLNHSDYNTSLNH